MNRSIHNIYFGGIKPENEKKTPNIFLCRLLLFLFQCFIEFQHDIYWLFSTLCIHRCQFSLSLSASSFVIAASFSSFECCQVFAVFVVVSHSSFQCHRWFHADQLPLKRQNMLSSRKNVQILKVYVLTEYGHRIGRSL